ncbi:MAG: sugar ABC transporter permease [Alphaproteobacteria bacterium]|nr:sugar ABC transporter permease [Alphaproteobacteria bacterium]
MTAPADRSFALYARVRRDQLLGWWFAAPAALLLLLLYLIPLLILIVLSLSNYELGAVDSKWVGLNNYLRAFEDPVFMRALRNTLLYVVLVLPTSIVLGLGAALLVHARTQSRSMYELIYFLPVTSTLIAMATVWQFMLHPKLGPVNGLISALGGTPLAFLSEPTLIIPTLAAIGIWQLVGFNMVLFLAGLSSIPQELYDAAAVDGADRPLDRFVRVTWPQLGPTSLFVLVTTSISAFKVFDTVAVLTQGKGESEVVLYAMYLEGFQYFKMGYAAALTVLFLAFILLMSALQTSRLDKKVHYA